MKNLVGVGRKLWSDKMDLVTVSACVIVMSDHSNQYQPRQQKAEKHLQQDPNYSNTTEKQLA